MIYSEYAEYQTKAEAEKHLYDRCIDAGLSKYELAKCINEIIETSRQPQRAEEDLKAQKEMAFWSKYSAIFGGVIGIVTIFAGGVGLYIAGGAWREARRAADIAREQVAASERPWLSIEAEIGGPLVFDKNGDWRITLLFKLENHGKVPAANAMISTEIFPSLNNVQHRLLELSKEATAQDPPLRITIGDTLFPGQIVYKTITFDLSNKQIIEHCREYGDINIDPNKIVMPMAIIGVNYLSPISGENLRTYTVVEIYRCKDNVRAVGFLYDGSACIPMEHLCARRWWPLTGPIS